MKNKKLVISALFLTIVVSIVTAVVVSITDTTQIITKTITVTDEERVAALEAELREIKDKQTADERLGQYAVNMMHRSDKGSKLSDAKKLILARAIVRVSNEIFEQEEHRKAFVAALAIESQFQRFAQSPTGPKGYAQLARNSFHEAMEKCGFKNAKDEDVWETDLNLYAGACYFRMVLEMPEVNQDPFIAIVGYNQGPNSADFKSYVKSGSLKGLEPLKYIAKFAYLKRTTTDEVSPGGTSMSDLQPESKEDLKATAKGDSLKKVKK